MGFSLILGWSLSAGILSQKFSPQPFFSVEVSPPGAFLLLEVSLPEASSSYFGLGGAFEFSSGFQFDFGLEPERDHHFREILASTIFFL